ncbi:hypothetical protein C1646_756810 [Rhizophagus diaphanus]|nr:hypothetical protein C1646_756810 [Rhizophagus diaphanus] [Rhizophagus sp. MUCL 43196]
MLVACKKVRYGFTLAVIKKWLNRQALYQIYKPRPKFIQYASFIDIQDLNDVHQSDTTPFSHCKIGNRIYKHRHAFQKIYDDPNYPLIWPNVLIIDRSTKFMGECKDLLLKYDVKIQYANSKRSVAIAERDHQEFEKYAYFWRPVGYNEPLLPSYTEVHHLLEPGELEGGRRRATDCNWSPEVFTIDSYLIKENQPILYKLYNGPKRSFVREELQIVPPDTVLLPKYILKH